MFRQKVNISSLFTDELFTAKVYVIYVWQFLFSSENVQNRHTKEKTECLPYPGHAPSNHTKTDA